MALAHQCSAEYSESASESRLRCPGFTFWAALSSLSICPANSSHLDFLRFPTPFPQFRVPTGLWVTPSFSRAWNSLKAVSLESYRTYFICFPSSCCLTFSFLETIVLNFILLSVCCCRWKNTSCPVTLPGHREWVIVIPHLAFIFLLWETSSKQYKGELPPFLLFQENHFAPSSECTTQDGVLGSAFIVWDIHQGSSLSVIRYHYLTFTALAALHLIMWLRITMFLGVLSHVCFSFSFILGRSHHVDSSCPPSDAELLRR